MRKLWDFKCPEGHVSEHYVNDEVTQTRCSCGAQAERIISPISFHLEGQSGDFPGAHMKWVRDHERAGGK